MQQAHWFTVTVGDWSDDGHGKTDTYLINSSLSKDDMEKKAYKAGCEVIGFDMVDTLCEGYEEGSIEKETVEAFALSGLDLLALADKWDREEYAEHGGLSVRDLWVQMWLHVCRLGASDLVAVVAAGNINIGGYGLRG